jgi:integrase
MRHSQPPDPTDTRKRPADIAPAVHKGCCPNVVATLGIHRSAAPATHAPPGAAVAAAIERVRAQLSQRDATLVSLMAYAGLRPDEATKARWGDLGERTVHFHASKTERSRTVDVPAPLAQDLAEWRLACGRPPDDTLICPTHDGDEWRLHDWQNWRRRVYQPAARAAGVTGDLRVYRLRGSFVSLLLWEGHSVSYVAEQAGHSVATPANHYACVLKELEDEPRVRAADAIRAARAEIRCAQNVRTEETGEGDRTGESSANDRVGDVGLEPTTSALSRRRSPS